MHRPDAGHGAGGDPDGRAGSALDPIATLKIEELINELRERYTIVIVTHNMQQASRVSQIDRVLHDGRGPRRLPGRVRQTAQIFTNPGNN